MKAFRPKTIEYFKRIQKQYSRLLREKTMEPNFWVKFIPEVQRIEKLTLFHLPFKLRELHIRNFGFIQVDPELIAFIKKHADLRYGILSLGAGCGFLERCINDLEPLTLVRAIDNKKETFSFGRWEREWYHIERKDAIAVIKEQKRALSKPTILLSWPSYLGSWHLRVLKKMEKDQKLIYLGEDYGGACASDEFFDYLREKFILVEEHNVFQVEWGIHDTICYVYQKEKRF